MCGRLGNVQNIQNVQNVLSPAETSGRQAFVHFSVGRTETRTLTLALMAKSEKIE